MTIAAEEEVWAYHAYLQNISWETYERLLKDLAEQNVRLTYDQGELEIMAPLPEHELGKTLLARLIETMAEELDIELDGLGSTTFKRKSLKKGLEPDECYYLKNAAAIRGKKRLDLRRDPPPDLVIEVDLSHRTIDKRVIYAAMRVPEIWSFDRGVLEFLHLRSGKYESREISLAFRFLKPSHVERFLQMQQSQGQTSIVKAWRAWVRKNAAAD